MGEPYGFESIQLLPESEREWIQAHPSYFFRDAVPSAEALVDQMMAGARALGAADVQALHANGWWIVASAHDWFASARFPVPDDLDALTAFPEFAQNSVRPECLIAAFAIDVLLRGPPGTRVVRGQAAPGDAILGQIERPDWARVIAFRGVDG